VLPSGANLGFAGGCNVGIRAAGIANFDFFWLLNTDTVVDADALSRLVARANADVAIGMTGSTIRYYDRSNIVQALAGARFDANRVSSRHIGQGSELTAVMVAGTGGREKVEKELSYIMGASMLVSRRFVEEVGLMREDYFLYYEEIDWAMRAHGRFTLAWAPDSHVFHKSGGSSTRTMSAFSTGFYYRNRVRFAGRFFPARLNAVRMALLQELPWHVLHGRWSHARIIAGTVWNLRKLARNAALSGAPPLV
jgi:hypothetical protein